MDEEEDEDVADSEVEYVEPMPPSRSKAGAKVAASQKKPQATEVSNDCVMSIKPSNPSLRIKATRSRLTSSLLTQSLI